MIKTGEHPARNTKVVQKRACGRFGSRSPSPELAIMGTGLRHCLMNSDKHSEKGYVDEAVLANRIESNRARWRSATLPVSSG